MKHRKHKKEHKHKKKRLSKKKSSSSDSDSDKEEMEWIEAGPSDAPSKTSNKREDWMGCEEFVSTFGKETLVSGRQRKQELKEEQRRKEMEIHQARELNPYLKPADSSKSELKATPSTSAPVGDGGYSYLRKAYHRVQEQAQNEGRSMEEVAAERWGSLGELKSKLAEAEAHMHKNSKHKYQHKKHHHHNPPHRSHYKRPKSRSPSPVSSPESEMKYKKPKDNKSYGKVNKFSSKNSYEKAKHHEHSNSQYFDSDENDSNQETHSQQKEKRVQEGSSQEDKLKKNTGEYVPAWKKNLGEAIAEASTPTVIPKKEPRILTKSDLNCLTAKLFKAELMGQTELAEKLKGEIEAAKSNLGENPVRQREQVLLTKMDGHGTSRPVISSREESGFSLHEKHKNRKYFDDGSKYSLKDMFHREKMLTTEDNEEMFLNVAKECREDDVDESMTSGISKKATTQMSHAYQEERDINKAIQQHQKLNSALEKCHFCLDQPNMKQHLIIDIRSQMYMCIPGFQSMIDGHCLIVPKRHVNSFLALDEDEWRESEDLKYELRSFFKEHDKSVLFIETSYNFRYFPHAAIECIPVDVETADLAPLYFKKAILESEEEWAHNIKLVDLSKKGLRHSVPRNMPYFSVQFDPTIHAGYAHVIEDERNFPRNFGKEVIGGIMDIDYNHLYKNKREDPLKKSNEALNFTRQWEKFKDNTVP